ncbi:MAG: 50S ribosomal protein L21 [Patescibacteria group bacterium]|nr:50S ribosomal protein L21 [Patescibacteria group bacterium]
MKYAVIKTGGKQYKVSENDVIEVERLEHDSNNVSFNEVLLCVDEGSVKIGKPFIPGLSVKAEVIKDLKGDKIRVSKFKSKVRYRRVTGHRQSLTKVLIKEIGSLKESPKVKKTKK